MTKPFLKNKFAAYGVALLCTLLWGTAFPFIKLGYSVFEIDGNDIGAKLLFAGLRFTLAGIMVLVFSSVVQKKFVMLSKNDIMPVSLLGIVQTAAQYIFTYIGIGFTSGTNTSIITACSSFFTVLFVPLFIKSDRLTLLKIAGCVFGFAGVIVINISGTISTNTFFGDSMILLSTISAAAANIISKKVAQNRNPLAVTAYQLLAGGIILVLCGIICGGNLNFYNLNCLWILLWLAFVSAAAFSMWTALLKYHPVSKISVFNLLIPVFGTVLSGILLGENVFKLTTLVSLVLISVGIIVVNMAGNKKHRRKSSEN